MGGGADDGRILRHVFDHGGVGADFGVFADGDGSQNLRAGYVEEKGFFYPPDPGDKSATIGGNVSTNAGGMRAVKYGVTRDYVRGPQTPIMCPWWWSRTAAANAPLTFTPVS